MNGQTLLDLVYREEVAVLLPWQRHCAELAVELIEDAAGWWGAFSYHPKETHRQGLGMPYRGPYISREAAIRNSVAHGVHCLRLPLGDPCEAARLYRAAGMWIAADRIFPGPRTNNNPTVSQRRNPRAGEQLEKTKR